MRISFVSTLALGVALLAGSTLAQSPPPSAASPLSSLAPPSPPSSIPPSIPPSTTLPGQNPSVVATAGPFLFAYFLGNGDGLHFASSVDGLAWTALKGGKIFLTPTVGSKLMRDPCIVRGPDGLFRMVWTSGWYDHGIGYATSRDLTHWSSQQLIDVMKNEPGAINCWAPELFYDDATKMWMIYWASTIPGRYPETDGSCEYLKDKQVGLNHRIYYVTTTDFQTFTDAKILYNDGFSVIDATLVKNDGKFVMIFKDETLHPTAKKNLRMATAEKMEGPYSKASAPFSPPGTWAEGPTAFHDGTAWLMYFDAYRDHHYGAMRSKDLVTWEEVTKETTPPRGIRHGTAFGVSAEVLAGVKRFGGE